MMSNEEKILAGLEDIRADLATIKCKVDEIEFKIMFGDDSEPPSDLISQMRELFPFTDEENEEFGKYMTELENQRGRLE